MKKSNFYLVLVLVSLISFTSCNAGDQDNETLNSEQEHTEQNQANLNSAQPAPNVTWSLERDNLIKRFKLQNDRSIMMYTYVFKEGVGTPIGYYQVNKVSSVNSQLTNPEQVVDGEDIVGNRDGNGIISMPSPSEDGSYGTNGEAIFGFTPDGLYMEHNMKYIVSTTPLAFNDVPMIGKISIKVASELKSKLKSFE